MKTSRDPRAAAALWALLTGCSVLGDFGSFEDEPSGDGEIGDGDGDGAGGLAGDGDGDSDTGGNVAGDGDTGGNVSGDGDGDGDGDTGGNVSGDGDGDGDGDTGGSVLGDGDGDGDGDGGTGGTGTGGAGSGGSGTGGAASGGAPGSGGSVSGSDGCGETDLPVSGNFEIIVEGATRSYTLDVPSDYDPDHPYPLTFALHAYQGNAASVASGGFYSLKAQADDSMIFVAPQGVNDAWPTGQQDIPLFEQLLDSLEASMCIDTSRVFAVGFSQGAMMTNTIGCALSDRFRAIAAYSGWLGCGVESGPIAYLGVHGTSDATVLLSQGRAARDEFRLRSGCSTGTTAFGSNGCVMYDGCASDHPVVWCEFGGVHTVPNFAADDTWNFLSQF